MPSDPATASAVEIAQRVRTREWSPVEITEALLARIEEWEPHLNAFVDLDAAGARHQARLAAEAVVRGDRLGPLHGVPVTVKNIQAVAGLPTRRGSRLSDAAPAEEDAPLVARLRAAGATIIGTTTLPEQGWTAVGDSPLTGATHTPWMDGRTSGGSSAGAGALAGAGCGPLHVGTDGADV
jgi:aspartyl-tRNA(Asn)/glutamyl-tRNA(Gln) amidotransferase subunit A